MAELTIRGPYMWKCAVAEKKVRVQNKKWTPPTHILPLVNIQRRMWKTANFPLLISLLFLYISLSQPLPGRQKSKNWNLSTLQCFTWFPSVSSTYLSLCVCVCVCACTKSCLTLYDPMDCSLPGSMEFSRQEYWSEVPFPSPGDLPDSGIESQVLVSPALAGWLFTTALPGKSLDCFKYLSLNPRGEWQAQMK